MANTAKAAFLFGIAVCGNVFAATKSLTTIYSFTGPAGNFPDGNVIVNGNGALFGVAYFGGSSNLGAVYELTPPAVQGGVWTAITIYSFAGGSDGSNPSGALVFDSKGALYGTTLYGGAANAGIVFELEPPGTPGGAWTESVLYTFSGRTDGGNPSGSLVFGSNGSLYGTASVGGSSGKGAVFELAPGTGAWTEAVIYNFAGGTDGSDPGAGLLFGSSGQLYGATYAGGSANCGTVFELAPAGGGGWTETLLHSFTGTTDGGFPESGLVADSNGALYGTTGYAGSDNLGTIYQMVPQTGGGAWTHNVIYSFSKKNGVHPFGTLVMNGAGSLFGTTYAGGAHNLGTVFALKPPVGTGSWTESVLHSFSGNMDSGGTGGGSPYSGLVFGSKTELYGTTFYGGTEGDGTVFQLIL